jgi:G3E family GTPase
MSTRLIIVGGFLGAGKTTFLLQAAQRLVRAGYRVGLMTNDQGEDLVDTALSRQHGVTVSEVAGGCFCCRFPDLLAGLEEMRQRVQADVILAEPVGSCTDLLATVLRPLTQLHGDRYMLAPLTVLLDGRRELAGFPADVHYLYDLQLAEAELLVLNKVDRLTALERGEKLTALQQRYPRASVTAASAQNGEGVDGWLAVALGQRSRDPDALVMDYQRYADAEAALGWLNAKGLVRADAPFSAAEWITKLLTTLTTSLAAQAAAVAHSKVLVTTPTSRLKASVTETGGPITWDLWQEEGGASQLEFLLNVRAHLAPAPLETLVVQAVAASQPDSAARHYFTHFECFSPLPPKPTYRI